MPIVLLNYFSNSLARRRKGSAFVFNPFSIITILIILIYMFLLNPFDQLWPQNSVSGSWRESTVRKLGKKKVQSALFPGLSGLWLILRFVIYQFDIFSRNCSDTDSYDVGLGLPCIVFRHFARVVHLWCCAKWFLFKWIILWLNCSKQRRCVVADDVDLSPSAEHSWPK